MTASKTAFGRSFVVVLAAACTCLSGRFIQAASPTAELNSPPSTTASATAAGYSGLAPEVREALQSGKVVTLESEMDGPAYTNRVVTLVEGDPAALISAFRDYAQLRRVYPEMKSLSFDRGLDQDKLNFAMKLHPLLPPINFSKQITWTFEPNGDAKLDIAFVSSDQRRVESQSWTMDLQRVSEDRTLLTYECADRYVNVVGKQRLLDKLHDLTARLACDLRARSLTNDSGARAGGQ